VLLKGKVAIVSGVGPGLGRESALAMAREGADLVLVARSTAVLDETRADIESLGRRAISVPADVADADACAAVGVAADEEFGRIDILLNNAFLAGPFSTIMDADLDDWRRVFDVNLLGSLNMTRAVVPIMHRQGEGRIIMTNSMQAYMIVDGYGAYASSKGALTVATRTLAAELGPSGIRVNGIYPGMIMGDNIRRYFATVAERRGCSVEEIERENASQAALRYIPTAEEMAGTVVYLASDLSRPVTGQSIGINAGTWYH
jgi:NAD(P)-dependent dehydrogenase (short-subunit alcohol dehydrogenase family)